MLVLILGFILIAIIHLFLLGKITFTAWPEMFSYPYLINNGFIIYKDFAHPYAPLLTFILSYIYKILGYELIIHQYFVYIVILINSLLIWLISLKILGKKLSSLIPPLSYMVLQPIFDGNMLWFDLGSTPLILLGLYLYLRSQKYFWLGLCLSLAILTKQQVILIAVLLGAYLLFKGFNQLKFFILGGIIPVAIAWAALYKVFPEYIFWTLTFPLIWLPKFPGYTQIPSVDQATIILLMFLPITIFLFKSRKISEFERILPIFLIGSLLMVFPRFSSFHLQPAIAILSVISAFLVTKWSKKFLILGCVIFVGIYMWINYKLFIGVDIARFYDTKEFSQVDFIKENSDLEDPIYLLGPHSLLYVLSNRLPPKPWIENFVWHFEIPGMQERFINALEKNPKTIIFKNPPLNGNWYDLGTYQPKKVIDYINTDYEKSAQQGNLEIWIRKD